MGSNSSSFETYLFFLPLFAGPNRKQSPFADRQKNKEGGLAMYQHASSQKLKIYSKNEIQLAKGLKKVRRYFWNMKGEEVCRDKTLRS